MKTSERATARISPLPERDRPVSERYRLAAESWVDLDGAARMLEAGKDIVLSQMIGRRSDMPVARAEREAKASDEWRDYIAKMVKARTVANRQKVEVEFLRMKFSEWVASDANARAERKL
jgi:hypothetical protein